MEREEWEGEATRERERREGMEEDLRTYERIEREARRAEEHAKEEAREERERADNLQDVLAEFQACEFSRGKRRCFWTGETLMRCWHSGRERETV